MSSVTSAHRLPPAPHPVDREPVDLSWPATLASAVGIVALLWLLTVLVGAL